MNSRKIEVLLAKNNKNHTLKINNIFLHSAYNPVKEAETFAKKNLEKLKDRQLVVVYGFGLGYHVREILKMLNQNAELHVFDIDHEVFNLAKRYGNINDILNDTRFNLYVGDNDDFYKNFKDILTVVEDIIIYEPSVRLLPEEYIDLKDALFNFIIGKNSIEKYGELAKKNIERNLRLNYKLIDEFIELNKNVTKPVVLVAAGPSLDETLYYLRRVRDKVKIFAVGSALKNLIKNEIIPDMFCIIDPQEIVYEQIEGFEDLEIPMCFLASASSKAVERYFGPKYLFFNEENEYESVVVETGKSVSTAVLSIAILCGAKTVFFAGLDLAFVNNKFHCNNYPYTDNLSSSNYMKVEGTNGEFVSTTRGMYYYKLWIEKKISQHQEIKFINLSKGAKVKGCQTLDLDDLLAYIEKNY
ncbi:motility associated factor glycosyltransferase family protein [Carboxydothermus pertinax]|uniref:6-hydroxymethylpterin diphosphokinase MptE-like domain-containing protein n=1 Tax=Carboxydothermus pertinax TaxID=870242 RepID=A0A1L8CUF0_9THEO|nr:6-hydroxymethylpterin diphosphokinase MptE-like protein [Carboxydothermus pertinax]GAV22543.1 hypothetical protein cpu_10530 [Carboxydothermus pertinax]